MKWRATVTSGGSGSIFVHLMRGLVSRIIYFNFIVFVYSGG